MEDFDHAIQLYRYLIEHHPDLLRAQGGPFPDIAHEKIRFFLLRQVGPFLIVAVRNRVSAIGGFDIDARAVCFIADKKVIG